MHSGNVRIPADEWDPTLETGFPSSSPTAPESVFGDLHSVTMSPGMKIFYLRNREDSIIHSTDIF